MPDGDLIRRGIRFSWKAAYEGLQAHEDASVVASRLIKAVARALRVANGVDCLDQATAVLTRFRSGESDRAEAFAASRRLASSNPRIAAVVEQALRRCIASSPVDIEPKHEMCIAIVNEVAQVELLSKARAALVEDGVVSGASSADRYIEDCRDKARVGFENLAGQLAAEAVGQKFRAPPSRTPRKTTPALMSEVIE